MKETMIEMFGEEWFNAMESYLTSDSFLKLGRTVFLERQKYNIYPEKEHLFRCFRVTRYDDVKVVMLGMDPYHNLEAADGLAFSNSRVRHMSPSLRNIIKEINTSYPEWKDDIKYGRLDKQDLSRWALQGVLLLNTAHTVREGKPGSHIKLWSKFTDEVIKTINRKNDIIWILLGAKAQEFKPYINKYHCILEASHPASEIYGHGGFFGSGIFKKCNEELEKRNKPIINW